MTTRSMGAGQSGRVSSSHLDDPKAVVQYVGFVVLVVASLAFGYWGLSQYAGRYPVHDRSLADLWYRNLQLFVLDSGPFEPGGPYPWMLQLARFTAPAATVYALFIAVRLIFARRWHAIRVRNSRGHAVVCGNTPAGRALCERLRADGVRVILVGNDLPVVHRAVMTCPGDPREPATLAAAGIGRAAALYACTEENTANLAVVLATASLRGGALIRVHALIDDPRLAIALRARRWALPQHDGLRLDFFNLEELAARRLLAHEALQPEPGAATHIVIAGPQPLGVSLLVEYARQWRLRATPAGVRFSATVVDVDALVVAEVRRRYPFVDEACDVTIHTRGLERLPSDGLVPHRVFLAYDDEEQALTMALSVERFWRGGPRSVVVRLDRIARLDQAFQAPGGGGQLLDALGGRLRFVDATRLACDPGTIHEDLTERLASAIHARYLRNQRDDPRAVSGTASFRPWEELSEERREANREQARYIGQQLVHLGCGLAVRESGGFTFTDDEVERLAIREHDRWMSERTAHGWAYGPVRDDVARSHPGIRPWDQLPETIRDKSRYAVRALSDLLADEGLEIIRLKCTADR